MGIDTGLQARGVECCRAIRSYAPQIFQSLKSLVCASLRAVAESERSMTRMRAAAAVVDQGITEMQTKVSIYTHIVFSLSLFRKCSLCDVTRITLHELHPLSPQTPQLHTPRHITFSARPRSHLDSTFPQDTVCVCVWVRNDTL